MKGTHEVSPRPTNRQTENSPFPDPNRPLTPDTGNLATDCRDTCRVWNNTFCPNKAFRSLAWMGFTIALTGIAATAGLAYSYYKESQMVEEGSGLGSDHILAKASIATGSLAGLGAISCALGTITNAYLCYRGDFTHEDLSIDEALESARLAERLRSNSAHSNDLVEMSDISAPTVVIHNPLAETEPDDLGEVGLPLKLDSASRSYGSREPAIFAPVNHRQQLEQAFAGVHLTRLEALFSDLGIPEEIADIHNPHRFAFLEGVSQRELGEALAQADSDKVPKRVQDQIDDYDLSDSFDQKAVKLLYLIYAGQIQLRPSGEISEADDETTALLPTQDGEVLKKKHPSTDSGIVLGNLEEEIVPSRIGELAVKPKVDLATQEECDLHYQIAKSYLSRGVGSEVQWEPAVSRSHAIEGPGFVLHGPLRSLIRTILPVYGLSDADHFRPH